MRSKGQFPRRETHRLVVVCIDKGERERERERGHGEYEEEVEEGGERERKEKKKKREGREAQYRESYRSVRRLA